ncbi:MAG: aminopeptidase [bacterium]
MDPRVNKLAKVMVHYSLKLKKGQTLKIAGEAVATPLITAVYEEAIKVGAHPYVQVRLPRNDEILLKHGSKEQLEYIPAHAKTEINKIDTYLGIFAASNTRYLAGVNPKQQVIMRKAQGIIMKTFFRRFAAGELKWCGTQFPTQADAQEADMSLDDYEDFVYGAGHINAADPVKHWQKVSKEQARLCKILDRVDQIHVRAEGTDLKLRVKGRKWINCAGTENFPDGEIFTCPIENTAEGQIRYSFPAVYGGREVEDVRLWFNKGKVVKEQAGKNEQYLKAMLDMDKGSRFLGEFAIGTNYEIKRFSRNILFDEKIGGTCHLAVGASIPEAGGKNQSSLHWDMVCDLKKKGSEITADGKVIYRNGKFTI